MKGGVVSMMQHMLTTTDNPFDPFTQFEQWFSYDASLGYHTPSFLARVTRSSLELSDREQEEAIEVAIDEIVKLNINGKYRKVSKEITSGP